METVFSGTNGSPQKKVNFIILFRKHMEDKAFGNELCIDFGLSAHFEFHFKITLLSWKVVELKQQLNFFHVLRNIMVILCHKTCRTPFYLSLFRITFPKSVNSSWRKHSHFPPIFELLLTALVSREAEWRTEWKRNTSFGWNVQLTSRRKGKIKKNNMQCKAFFYHRTSEDIFSF